MTIVERTGHTRVGLPPVTKACLNRSRARARAMSDPKGLLPLAIRQNVPVSAIVVVFVAVRGLSLLLVHHGLIWDEAVFVGMGRYAASGGAVGLWESIRPPVLPLLLGALAATGLPAVPAGRVLALACAAATLCLSYGIAKDLFDRRVAAIAAFTIAITPPFFRQSVQVLTEIPSLLLALLSIWLLQRGRIGLCGVAAGLAFLARFPAGLVLLALAAGLAREPRPLRRAAVLLAGFAAPVLPYLGFNLATTGSVIRPLLLAGRHVGNTMYRVEPAIANLGFYVIQPVRENPVLAIWLIGSVVCLRWGRRLHARRGLVELLVFGVCSLAFFSAIINKQTRFLVGFLPPFAVLAAVGVNWALVTLQQAGDRKPRVFAGLVIVLVALGSGRALTGDAWLLRHTESRDRAWQEAYAALDGCPGGAVMTTDPIPAATLNRAFVPVYSFAEDDETADQKYLRDKDRVHGVLWSPTIFECDWVQGDDCRPMLARMERTLDADATRVFDRTLEGRRYIVFCR